MALPKIISDWPLEYTYYKKINEQLNTEGTVLCQHTFAVSKVVIPASYLSQTSTRNAIAVRHTLTRL